MIHKWSGSKATYYGIGRGRIQKLGLGEKGSRHENKIYSTILRALMIRIDKVTDKKHYLGPPVSWVSPRKRFSAKIQLLDKIL